VFVLMGSIGMGVLVGLVQCAVRLRGGMEVALQTVTFRVVVGLGIMEMGLLVLLVIMEG